MKFYKSYSFVDKDPAIDFARTAIQDSGLTYQQVSELSDVSVGTMIGWFHGKTRRPQYATIMAVMRGIGYEQRWVKTRAKRSA
jgi:transcriptional regulator with XRE-family HTH domain